ncbi:MAG: hypothetical protein BMS9Abin08_0472 [Gammaproteobacteria bacterium]|nr:MAG: hypothetical protein BMS9Abin08_0472 [Gammaproteobacteria bacterium]
MNTVETLRVTSHVGRDLLASAASFKTEAATVWEYVVNSLQYVDEGVLPRVQVLVKPRNKLIEIRDNGRGMSAEGLRQYFTMHGENIDRLRGRPGRGKFGTGKAAAFGIGKLLRIDTRKDGLRNVVELHRDDIDTSTGEDIELSWTIHDEPTNYANGTTVTIEDTFLQKLSAEPIIEYIERHLQPFRAQMPEVAVNEHVCQYREPTVADSHVYKAPDGLKDILGNVELIVKVSVTPLPASEQGVAITAGMGNLVAIEAAGIERKELGNYIFGEIDVPALETFDSPMEAYDPTRSLQLNPHHPVSRVLLSFIGSKLEEVRREQLKKLNEARKTEDARRLASEAQNIADVLNKDFKNVMGRLQDIRSASARPGDVASAFGDASNADEEEGVWIEGTTIPGDIETPTSKTDTKRKEGMPQQDPQVGHTGNPNENGKQSVDPAGGAGGKRRRPRGGFKVEYRNLGDDADRSKYDRTNLTILINIDHKAVKNALRGVGVEDINFRRLSYEIAFTEYSIALGYELAELDPDIPADDLLYEVRTTLNRVSSSAAALYA